MDIFLLKQLINYLYCRGRNIIYYSNIDDRERAQYMHVLRDFRKDAKDLLNEFPKNYLTDPELKNMRSFLLNIISLIPKTVTTKDCRNIIDTIEKTIYVKQ